MSAYALMQKEGEGRMNVPPHKVAEFVAAGWVVIQPADALPEVKQTTLQADQLPVQVEADDQPVTIPEAVERLKKGKSKPRKG